MSDSTDDELWGRASLRVFSDSLDQASFERAVATLGTATGKVEVQRTKAGWLWHDRALLPDDASAQDLWSWVFAEVDAVLGELGGPPPGCTAELWLGLSVPGQRGLWCEAAELGRLADRRVDLVFDLYS